LEKFCLADFVAWFECAKDTQRNTRSQASLTASSDFLPETNFEETLMMTQMGQILLTQNVNKLNTNFKEA